MESRFSFLLILILTSSCRGAESQPNGGQVQQRTLPPVWTSTPSSTNSPNVNQTSMVTPTATQTPYPAGYEESPWVIRIEGPELWKSATSLVELSDGAIMAAGIVPRTPGRDSLWLARLTRAGEVTWLSTIALPGDHKYYEWGMGAGPAGTALISGNYTYPAEGGGLKDSPVTFSVTPSGQIEWLEPYATDSFTTSREDAILFPGFYGASIINARGDLQSHLALNFGEGFRPTPMAAPMPEIIQGTLLPDQGTLFTGNFQDYVIWSQNAERAGPDLGIISYWFARFSSDGELVWKHFYDVDPLQQGTIRAATTSDGGAIAAGTFSTQAVSDVESSVRDSYVWVRKVDLDGGTVFHRRYLDMPLLVGVYAAPDGGAVLFGKRFIDAENSALTIEQAQLVKLDADGKVEWARAFQEGLQIHAVLPLHDGSYLISFGRGMMFARLDSQGWLPGCQDIVPGETRMRVDNAVAEFDTAGQVPLAMSIENPEPVQPESPAFSLSPAAFTLHESCRTLPGDP